ncbi:MAG: hypothetical protein R3D28_10200 [Geminicoccaceae bacterium]
MTAASTRAKRQETRAALEAMTGRQRPAERAAHGVHAEGPGHAVGRDVVVENGVVGRMEDRVAEAEQDGGRRQGPVARRHGDEDGADAERGEAERQDLGGTDAVDDEAGRGLGHGGDREEHGHDQRQLGVGDVERFTQPGKEGRQHRVEEMAPAMRGADHADDPDVALEPEGRPVHAARCLLCPCMVFYDGSG